MGERQRNTASCGCQMSRSEKSATFIFCRLHAAAPDLLAALEQSEVMLEQVRVYMATLQETDAPIPEDVGLLLGAIEAAIAKAKGDDSDTYVDEDGTIRRIRDDYEPIAKAKGEA
jgi:hypothetical protein